MAPHALEMEKPQGLIKKPEKLILDDPSRVIKVLDRGESSRLRKQQEQYRNSRPPIPVLGVRRGDDSEDDSSLIEDIAFELDQAKTAYPLEPEKKFIPHPRFAKILSFERVRKIVLSLKGFKKEKRKEELVKEIYYGRSDGSKGPAVKLLAVLIGIEKPVDFFKHFSDGMRDSCLPLQKNATDGLQYLSCRRHGNHPTLNGYRRPQVRESFATWSYALSAPFIKWEPQRHSHYILDTGDVIPMEIVDKVKQEDSPSDIAEQNAASGSDNTYGGFSEVYKVKIHEGHWDFGNHGIRHPQGFFALKILTSHKSIDFNLEVSSLLFTHKKYNKKHLIQLLATFEVVNPAAGVSTFYLLFDWAEGSLTKFWQSNHNLVGKKEHCLWMATQFYEISDALQCVHNERARTLQYLQDRDSNDALYGRHGDIKPGNFLWFHSKTTSGPGLLALSDFGLGRLHTQVSRSKQDPRNIERTATYRCPEFDLQHGQISPRSDIFSLGCVFLEYITWFFLGYDAVENVFPDRRLENDVYGIEADVFFSIRHNQAILKPAVADWIQYLQNRPDCCWYIWDVLDCIGTKMLDPDSNKRISSSQLTKRMKELLKACEADSEYFMGTTANRNSG